MASTGGAVVERTWKSGRGYALRVIAYGQRWYVTLGSEHDGWTRPAAEEELANIAADVRRGTWVPPDRNKPKTPEAAEAGMDEGPTFAAFAAQCLSGRQAEVSERMYEYLDWALRLHLIPYFAQTPLADFSIELVDEYRRHKVVQAEALATAIEKGQYKRDERGLLRRPLSPGSINKTIDILAWVLSLAVEYDHLTKNPASGRRRRLKKPPRRPIHLDSTAQIQALLDAAGQMDRDPSHKATDRRASIAALVLAGPRAHEHNAIVWRDVDLANGRIEIGRSKTQAGLREIHLLPLLRDELAAHKAACSSTGPDDLVFPTLTGTRRDKNNLRNRVLAPVLPLADELLLARDHTPLPSGLSPHKLRHTFASILVACGDDPASVMSQLGHTDPKFTLRVYTHLMGRDKAERERLKALVYGSPMPDLTSTITVQGAH